MTNATGNTRHAPFFDEIDPMERTFFILEAMLLVPTLFGNILILLSIRRYRWLQSPLNTLIANLAVSDLIVSVVLIPLDVVGTFLGMHKFIEVCLLSMATLLTFVLMSLFSMLAISVERFFSVTYPLQHRSPKTRRAVNIFIVVGWPTTIAISSIPLVNMAKYRGYTGSCRMHVLWEETYLFLVDLLMIGALVANVVFFALVVRVALQKLPNYGDEHPRMQRKLAKTYALILVSATFVVCWAPYCFITLYNILTPSSVSVKVLQGWTLLLGFCNSSLNWLIYGLKNEKFRRAFRLILCRRCSTPPRDIAPERTEASS